MFRTLVFRPRPPVTQELAVPTVVDYKVDSVVDMVVDMVVDLVVDWGAIIHMPAVSMPPPWKPPEPNAAL